MSTLLHHCLILGAGMVFGMVFGAYIALYCREREEARNDDAE